MLLQAILYTDFPYGLLVRSMLLQAIRGHFGLTNQPVVIQPVSLQVHSRVYHSSLINLGTFLVGIEFIFSCQVSFTTCSLTNGCMTRGTLIQECVFIWC